MDGKPLFISFTLFPVSYVCIIAYIQKMSIHFYIYSCLLKIKVPKTVEDKSSTDISFTSCELTVS